LIEDDTGPNDDIPIPNIPNSQLVSIFFKKVRENLPHS
jgi:hypothetical protein